MADAREVFEAFTAAVAGVDGGVADEVHAYADSVNELPPARAVVQRALTAASRAASLSAGEDPRTSLIATGDDALLEIERPHPLNGPDPVETLAELEKAMNLAGEHLGPLRAGLRGEMPGGVREHDPDVEPTQEEMVDMARASGKVVGRVSGAGKADALAETRLLIEGCPWCGQPVELTGSSHQQLGPGTGPVKETGQCPDGHYSTRPQGVVVPWESVWDG